MTRGFLHPSVGAVTISVRKRLVALSLIGTLVALGGCDDTPNVVLYVSADEYVARQVLDVFEREHDIDVRLVGDTEATKTTGLVQRLRSERDRPLADVFWSSEVFQTIGLAEEGVLEPFQSPAVRDWPEQWRDPQRRWYGFAGRARVIVYSPQRLDGETLPVSWMDLTDQQWRGRIVMADPRFGTTGGHLGAMRSWWDRRFQMPIYGAFLEGLAANEVRLLPSGNAGVVRAVADGEADLGMTDTDDVWAARANGLRVELIYPRHGLADMAAGGTLLIPNTVARVRGGPNPEAAGLLIDFLLSETVERLLARSASRNIPLGAGRADGFPELAVPEPLGVDLNDAAGLRHEAIEEAMNWLSPDHGD